MDNKIIKSIKNIYTLFCFIYLLLYPSIIKSQWQTISTGINSDYYDVCVVNSNVIWSVGSKIVKSIDGGQNWQIANPNNPNINGSIISSSDELHSWVTQNQIIHATSDGGQSWFNQYYSPANYINAIHFFNQSTGILLTDPVKDTVGFFITRNGGVNWVRSINSPVISGTLIHNCLNVYDTSFIWFNDYINGQGEKFFKLTGGLDNAWQFFDIPFSPQSCCFFTIFKDINNGIASDGFKIIYTSNGGINWISLTNTALGSAVSSIINVPNTNWIILNNGNRVRISYDWCNTWQSLVTLPYPPAYFGNLDCYDTNSIWMCGMNGLMYKYNYNFISVKNEQNLLPNDFMLFQNYPNPFNASTKIKFQLNKSAFVKLIVYDVTGSEAEILIDEFLPPDLYEAIFNGSDFPSGIYYYSLFSENYSTTKKLVLIK